MRYEKSENLLKLALEMQGSRIGLTIADIQEKFAVARRTAERMRGALENLFPDHIEQANPGEVPKRWRIHSGVLNGLAGFTAEEIAELNNAIAILKRDNLDDQANALEGLERKIRAITSDKALRLIEPDLGALIEAEGLAMRPGPRPKIKSAVLSDLREAIKRCVKVRLHYRARGTRQLSRQIVCPYGFL